MSKKIVVVNYYDESEDEFSHIVGSRANRTKNYEYLAPEDAKGTEKYAVVKPSPTKSKSAGHGLKIVKIVEFRDASQQEFDGDLKRVVSVIDMEPFEAHQELYAKKKALATRIESKIAELSKIAQLRILAQTDADAKALLDLYESL